MIEILKGEYEGKEENKDEVAMVPEEAEQQTVRKSD